MDTLVTNLSNGFSDLADTMLGALGSIAPVMLPVIGGVAVISLGIVVFKKLGK